MQIADAGFVERGGKLALGKAGAARGRDRAGIDQQIDFRALEFVEHRGGLGLLVADGEQRMAFRRLSFAPSFQSFDQRHGGRRRAHFASWMK